LIKLGLIRLEMSKSSSYCPSYVCSTDNQVFGA